MNKNTEKKQDALTEEELSLLQQSMSANKGNRRLMARQQRTGKARLVRYIRKNKIFAVTCVILAVCMVTLLILSAVFVAGILKNRENTDDFTVFLGDDSYTAKYKDVMRDGILYVDMRRIAEYTDLIVTGSATSVKFTYDEDNYLRFENGSTEAVINGSMVELGGAATVNAQVCEVPYEFLTKAVGDGLKFALDRETNTIRIRRVMYVSKDQKVYIPKEILTYEKPE